MRRTSIVGLMAGIAIALASASSDAAPLKKSSASKAKQEMAQSAQASTDQSTSAAMPAPDLSTVSGRMRDALSSSKGDRLFSRKGERQAVDAVYQKHDYKPLWIEDGKATSRATAVLDYIKTIDTDGLDPSEYNFPSLTATSVEGQADAELKFTSTLLTYARHALNGRMHWSRVTAWVYYKDNYDPTDVLTRISDESDVASVLNSFNPQSMQYKTLKAKLAELRAQQATDPAPKRLSYGQYLKYGSKSKSAKDKGKNGKAEEPVAMMQDPRVPLIREKLGLPAKNDTNYDKELAEAVAKFQDANGLKPDGEVGNPTIDALNGPGRENRINSILATMERWRWMPRDLGKTYVILNIPEFTLKVWHEGSMVWTTRVVVGKLQHETPLLSETMKFITVNPTWNVPQSIVYNELLPIYEGGNPNIFAQQGLRVEQGKDGIRVYQPPGDRNALGRVRFNFPNKFLVYQHDTPEKQLFSKETRAYSHGCMRVQDPVKYAEVLLTYAVPNKKYTQESIRRMFGDNEINIDFPVQIPVHITYQTAFVDEAGNVQFKDDVYGYDAKMTSILKGHDRRVADIAIERPADPNYKPSPTDFARLENVPRDGGGDVFGGGYSGRRGGGGDPFAFFGRIFR
jgi:murein L,D-transpeptidase YcbB/YkuD